MFLKSPLAVSLSLYSRLQGENKALSLNLIASYPFAQLRKLGQDPLILPRGEGLSLPLSQKFRGLSFYATHQPMLQLGKLRLLCRILRDDTPAFLFYFLRPIKRINQLQRQII